MRLQAFLKISCNTDVKAGGLIYASEDIDCIHKHVSLCYALVIENLRWHFAATFCFARRRTKLLRSPTGFSLYRAKQNGAPFGTEDSRDIPSDFSHKSKNLAPFG